MRLHRINGLLMKYYYLSISSMFRLLDLFYWPVLMLFVFGFTASYIEGFTGVSGIFVFLIGGLVMWVFFERVQQDTAVYLLEDFWERNVSNLFITPVTESEQFFALAIFGLFRSIISFLLVGSLALVVYKFNIFSGDLTALIYSVPLFIFGWAVGIAICGLLFVYGYHVFAFAWAATMLLQPVAAAFYPLETLPLWLQKVALLLPLAHIFEGFREAYQGNFSMSNFLLSIVMSLGYLLIGYFVYAYSVRRARRTGLIAKY